MRHVPVCAQIDEHSSNFCSVMPGTDAPVGISAFLYLVALCNCVQLEPFTRGILLLLQVFGQLHPEVHPTQLGLQTVLCMLSFMYLGAHYWQLLMMFDSSGGTVPSVVPSRLGSGRYD